MSKMIDIKKLSKHFGPLVAVDQVSFSVSKGEVLGFLGPNGAGKSTTMKMLTGFLNPTSGTASVCGHDILDQPIKAKSTLGYLPEGAPAYPDMTPLSFLKFIAQIRGYSGAELRRRVDEAIAKTALESHLNLPIEALSKGFKRRLGLAQAILHDPPVLVMDEPTDGLDPNQKYEVRNLIQQMAQEKAIILSTHILEEVEAVCTRAIIIAAGKVIADCTPTELQEKAANHNAVTLSVEKNSAPNIRGDLEKIQNGGNIVEVSAENGLATYRISPKDKKQRILHQVSDLARQKNWKVEEMREEQGRLDEVFRSLTMEATAKAGRES